MKINYKQCAEKIVNLIGTENIQSVSHCMTRLRFSVKDIKRIDQEALKKIQGVLGVIYASGQLQVIMGQNLLPVFEEVLKLDKFDVGEEIKEDLNTPREKLTLKSAGSAILGYISASVTPMLPGLIAGGMLKVFLLIVTLISSSFAETQTYIILSFLANAPFYFMPIFVAFGASKKLGGTPIYAMLCSAALLSPEFITMVGAGEAITLFSLPVKAVGYSSSLVPALLISLVAYYSEKFFNKIVPGIFKSIFVGFGTIVVTMTLGLVVLGPLGSYIGSYLALAFVWLGNIIGPVALGVLAAVFPWLIMCGMHTALVPFMAQAIADPGYDSVFRPAFILHNMAEGGACLGVALRTKNKELRSEALSIGFGCIFAGVSEPAIYGINLRFRKPMIGVMTGGAVGGVIAGIMGAKAYVMGYSTILALPIFQDTVLAMLIGIIVCIVVSAVVTYILGFEDDVVGSSNVEEQAKELPVVGDDKIVAIADAEIIPLEEVNDEAFSQKLMGDGIAFKLVNNQIVSPCNGTLSVVFPTGHAFGITMKDGTELLIHIGIDTVELDGKGFTPLVDQGDMVKAGQPIVKINKEEIEKAGYDTTTMLIVTGAGTVPVTFGKMGYVNVSEVIN